MGTIKKKRLKKMAKHMTSPFSMTQPEATGTCATINVMPLKVSLAAAPASSFCPVVQEKPSLAQQQWPG